MVEVARDFKVEKLRVRGKDWDSEIDRLDAFLTMDEGVKADNSLNGLVKYASKRAGSHFIEGWEAWEILIVYVN